MRLLAEGGVDTLGKVEVSFASFDKLAEPYGGEETYLMKRHQDKRRNDKTEAFGRSSMSQLQPGGRKSASMILQETGSDRGTSTHSRKLGRTERVSSCLRGGDSGEDLRKVGEVGEGYGRSSLLRGR